MAVRKVYLWPDPILKQVAEPVTVFDDALHELVRDMFDTMYKAHGVGLSGNQVGVLKQIITLDCDPNNLAQSDEEIRQNLEDWGFKGPVALINPRIVEQDGSLTWREGCLSVPGVYENVERYESIRVEAEIPQGSTIQIKASGLFSVAIQHEMDHLKGRVFVEYLSRIKRDSVKRKMNKLRVRDIDDGVAAAEEIFGPA